MLAERTCVSSFLPRQARAPLLKFRENYVSRSVPEHRGPPILEVALPLESALEQSLDSLLSCWPLAQASNTRSYRSERFLMARFKRVHRSEKALLKIYVRTQCNSDAGIEHRLLHPDKKRVPRFRLAE